MIRKLILAISLACTAPLGLAAADAEQSAAMIGPVVGTEAPDFSAVLPTGDAADFAAITGDKGAVLVFSRSLDWCPYCKKQALELKDAAAPLAEDGWALNLITYDPPQILADYAEDEALNYTLLSDTNSAMIDAFKLRNMGVTAGSRFDGIPHPAVVFVSNDGVVRAFMREEGYKDRPPAAMLVESAGLLNQTGLFE